MKTLFYLYLLLVLIFIGCSRYEPVSSNTVTAAQIDFMGENGQSISTLVHYSVPPNYDANKSSPLIIALHGSGSNSAAFHDLWKMATDSLGFILLTVQGEQRTAEGIGWTWGQNADRSILVAMNVIKNSVHVDAARIYVAGFSSGGRLAYFTGLKYANFFQGFAALSASFDKSFLPPYLPKKMRIYIAHGELETTLVKQSEIAVHELLKLDADVNYTQYPGIGHHLPEPKIKALVEIVNFLHSQ